MEQRGSKCGPCPPGEESFAVNLPSVDRGAAAAAKSLGVGVAERRVNFQSRHQSDSLEYKPNDNLENSHLLKSDVDFIYNNHLQIHLFSYSTCALSVMFKYMYI